MSQAKASAQFPEADLQVWLEDVDAMDTWRDPEMIARWGFAKGRESCESLIARQDDLMQTLADEARDSIADLEAKLREANAEIERLTGKANLASIAAQPKDQK